MLNYRSGRRSFIGRTFTAITGLFAGLTGGRAASAAVTSETEIIEAVNYDANGKITALSRQPELRGKIPPRDWGCFRSIEWKSIAVETPRHGDTVLMFGCDGPSLVQFFEDRFGGNPHYRGVSYKYGPMAGMFMEPYITHWAVLTWPKYVASPCRPSGVRDTRTAQWMNDEEIGYFYPQLDRP